MATTTTEIRGASNGTILMSEESQWVSATILEIRDETPTVKTFRFRLSRLVKHEAGQHYEIRLTAPNGYQAARLYSAASAASGNNELELTVALLPDGEVSPYMHHAAKVGDQIEVRGPLGKFFVWKPEDPSPVLLIAGGSGVVPMRCMLQAHQAGGSNASVRLLYSARTSDEIIYKTDLLHSPVFSEATTITITGESGGWTGRTGRIDGGLIKQALAGLPSPPLCYVCGATPFVEAMADLLVSLGIDAARIKTERFGATAPSSR